MVLGLLYYTCPNELEVLQGLISTDLEMPRRMASFTEQTSHYL